MVCETTGPHSQTGFAVRLDWGVPGLADIGQDVEAVVVVDVLSFTTAVEVACSRGAHVYACRWTDARAGQMATRLGAALAVCRAQVSEQAPYSLSPVTLMRLAAGKKLVLPSPNGAEVSLAAADIGSALFAASLRNRRAVAAAVEGASPVAIVAAGERRADGSLRPALEDLIGAGAVIEALPGTRSPESALAVAVWTAAENSLADMVRDCASGRELVQSGYHEDVRLAAEVDVSNCVPRWSDRAFISAAAQ